MNDQADIFRQEARDLLDSLEQALLDLEQDPNNQDLVDSAFRALHTIKGSGAMFGFDKVASFAHAFEAAFDRVRKKQADASHDLIAVALVAKDYLYVLIETPEMADAGAAEEVLHTLQKIVDAGSSAKSQSAPRRTPVTPSGPLAVAASGLQAYHIRFRLPAGALAMGANPLLMLDELRALGTAQVSALVDQVPLLCEIKSDQCYLGWDVHLLTLAPREEIEDVFMFLRDDMELDIALVAGAASAAVEQAETQPAKSRVKTH